jgi:hypothetical protein
MSANLAIDGPYETHSPQVHQRQSSTLAARYQGITLQEQVLEGVWHGHFALESAQLYGVPRGKSASLLWE